MSWYRARVNFPNNTLVGVLVSPTTALPPTICMVCWSVNVFTGCVYCQTVATYFSTTFPARWWYSSKQGRICKKDPLLMGTQKFRLRNKIKQAGADNINSSNNISNSNNINNSNKINLYGNFSNQTTSK